MIVVVIVGEENKIMVILSGVSFFFFWNSQTRRTVDYDKVLLFLFFLVIFEIFYIRGHATISVCETREVMEKLVVSGHVKY
jgi:hypothetical protein